MLHVPRIEVHPWNNQPLISPSLSYVDDDDENYENIPPFDYTPVHSTLLDEQPRVQPTLGHNPPNESNESNAAERQQTTRQTCPFWSRLRRSKSDDGCYCVTEQNSTSPLVFGHERPQPAMRGGRLFWSPEQQMWLFERRQRNDEPASNHHHRHFRFHRHRHRHHDNGATKLMGEDENRRRALSATTPRRRPCRGSGENSDDGDDMLLSAHLPGHYSLSPHQQQQSCSSSESLLLPDLQTLTAEGPWLSVASKVTSRDPLR